MKTSKAKVWRGLASALTISVISVMLTSCVGVQTSTVGSYFNYEARTELKAGMNQQTAIQILEGSPDEKTNNDDGTYDLTWRYAKGNSLGKGEGYGLIIRFSSSGEMVKIVKEATRKLK
jgi:outer membrane protein assembly factor BamE (lipoprotein component of BamABCDE complex)